MWANAGRSQGVKVHRSGVLVGDVAKLACPCLKDCFIHLFVQTLPSQNPRFYLLYNCRVYLKVCMNMYTNRFIMIYIHTHTFIYHISSYFFICTICTHVTDSLPANSNTTFCISDNGFSSRKAGYCRAANGRWLCGICPEGEMDTISGYDFSVSKAFSLATKLDFWAYTVGLGRCFWKDRHKS